MGVKTAARAKQPDVKTITLHDLLKGRRTDTDITRTENGALAISDDAMLTQDGVVTPRYATVPYGTQPLGEVLGWDTFTKIVAGKPESWIITVQKVSGTANVYVSKDGGAWIICLGKTYATADTTFVQASGKVLVMNGSDYLSYLDTNTLAIVSYTALLTPGAPTATPTGMTGAALTYRFRITAVSSIGETDASPAATVATSISRDQWTQSGGTPHYVTLSWSAVAGSKGYCIYVGTDVGKETFIGVVPATSTSYVDDGSAIQIATKLAPLGNSTQGPIVQRGANIAGQVYLVQDKDNAYHVWYGGTGDDTFDFSSYNGGGWIDIAVGSKYVPVAVVPFRDGKGTPMATVFSDSASGAGKITHLSLQTLNYGDSVITYMAADEANGQDGTSSPEGIGIARDSLFYPSGHTFKTTGTKPQVQNILSTGNISDGILRDMKSINYEAMGGASVALFDGLLCWALPVGSSTNSQIWTLDLTRGGQWMLPWRFAAKKLMVYGSNDKEVHFLALTYDHKIVEFTTSRATEDSGVGFNSRIGSGYIKSEETGSSWMYVLDILVTLINPQGNVTIEVKGKTKSNAVKSLADKPFLPQVKYAGWGEIINGADIGWGHVKNGADIGWGNIISVPASYGSSRVTKLIKVKKPLNYLQWIISSIGKGSSFELSDVVIRYVDIGIITTEEMRR